MTITVLQPDATAGKDTQIVANFPTNNFGIRTDFEVGTLGSSPEIYKGIIEFDLSSIPSDATVISATLSVFCTAEQNTTDRSVTLRRGFVAWFEGFKNLAAPDALQDGSTWNLRNANGSLAWGAAGGLAGTDYALVGDATDTVSITGANTWFDFDVTPDVQGFIDGSFTNFGWWFVPASGLNTLKDFASSDHATAGNRPQLTIEYIVMEGSAAGQTSISALLTASGRLVGITSGSSTDIAELTSNLNIGGLSLGQATVVGTLHASGSLEGLILGSSSSIADLNAEGHLLGSSAGQATNVAHLFGQYELVGLSSGSSTASATPSFEGALRGQADGSSIAIATGYARAVGLATLIGCTPVPLLYITDGSVKTNGQLNLLNLISERSGYKLKSWKPKIAQYKDGGRFSSSPLSQGRRLTSRSFDNAIDVFDLSAVSKDQDELIFYQQELLVFQEAAADYWISNWAIQPIYLVGRAGRETNTRYAIIHMISIPELENPYQQPFFDSNQAAIDTLTLRVERGHWLSTPPGEFECVSISSIRSWTVSGWQAGV